MGSHTRIVRSTHRSLRASLAPPSVRSPNACLPSTLPFPPLTPSLFTRAALLLFLISLGIAFLGAAMQYSKDVQQFNKARRSTKMKATGGVTSWNRKSVSNQSLTPNGSVASTHHTPNIPSAKIHPDPNGAPVSNVSKESSTNYSAAKVAETVKTQLQNARDMWRQGGFLKIMKLFVMHYIFSLFGILYLSLSIAGYRRFANNLLLNMSLAIASSSLFAGLWEVCR